MELDELVKEFLVESYENLDQLDRDFIVLEQDPTNEEILARIFRTIHTIKGTCGFLGFEKLEKVSHVGENLLSRLRDGELVLNPEITSALLTMVDAVRQMLACIESTAQDGEDDYPELVATLTRLHDNESPADSSTASTETPDSADSLDPPEAADAPQPVSADPPQAAAETSPAPPAQSNGRPAAKTAATGEQPPATSVSDSTIRVDVRLLDKLMNLVGELVLTRNQVMQYTLSQQDTAFGATSQRLNLITSELQEGVMKTRMQPIGNVWSKFPRVVRDLAVACGKRIRVEMEGKETELDKTIIEAIKDPLTHLVRNAADHGVEDPEVRMANGKPAEGCLRLHAYHEGGQVNIEISDDGGGIDPEKIKAKALEKGLIAQENAERMSDREVGNLIFLPGFSTAAQVTNVSGRGVGMDVVKTNIEKLGGTVDVQSVLGKGTTFKVKIPLTLAIIPALTVTSGGSRYAIPQINLLELVRLEGEHAQASIERIQGAPVYRLRGNLLPLVFLNHELGLDPSSVEDEQHIANIVVLQADDRQFGLVVDAINDTQEIVVKPLGKILKGLSAFAGATIMGDGRVALILDVLGLAQQASVVTETHDRATAEVV